MYLRQLLACIDVLLRLCDSDCRSVSLQLLQVLITVQSLSVDPQLSDKVQNFFLVYVVTLAHFSKVLFNFANR